MANMFDDDQSILDLERSALKKEADEKVQETLTQQNADAIRQAAFARITALAGDTATVLISRGAAYEAEKIVVDSEIVVREQGLFWGRKTEVRSHRINVWIMSAQATGDPDWGAGDSYPLHEGTPSTSGLVLQGSGALYKYVDERAYLIMVPTDIEHLGYSVRSPGERMGRPNHLSELQYTTYMANEAIKVYQEMFLKLLARYRT